MRSRQLLGDFIENGLVKWNGSLHRWTFFNGSILQFCHLQHENDVSNYQSQQFDVILFDEATHFTRSMVRYMLTRNRSATGNIPRPFVAMGTNPGNIGHMWFKEEFVDAGEPEKLHIVEVEEGKFEEHIFIPAKLSDNQALEENDPEYRQNLENQPDHIRRQLLDGDWDALDGVAFAEFRKAYHVCEPFDIPEGWIKFRSMDWGYAKPYSVGWYAIDFDGRIYKYRELYGHGGENDKGSRESPAEVAKKIWEAENYYDSYNRLVSEELRYAVADDAVFGGQQDNSKSIAEQFQDAFMKIDQEKGTRTRLWERVGKGRGSRVQGKLELHQRLRLPKDKDGNPTGERPFIMFFNTCHNTLRTLPVLVVDERNPEDVDTTQEDHSYDETRYACMSRPMTPKEKKPEESVIRQHKVKLIKRLKNTKRFL